LSNHVEAQYFRIGRHDEKSARALAEERAEVAKSEDLESRSKVTLENLFASLEAAQNKVFSR